MEATIAGLDTDRSNKQTENLEEIKSLFQDQFCEIKLFVRESLDSIQSQINMNNQISSELVEEVTLVKNRVMKNLTKNENPRVAMLREIHPKQKPHIINLNKGQLDNSPNQIIADGDVCSKTSQEVNVLKNELKEISNRNKNSEYSISKTLSQQNVYTAELSNRVSVAQHVVGISETKLNRLLWVVIHSVAFLISAKYIEDAYNSWQNSLIVQVKTYSSVKDIPFPAVTICEPLLLKDEYHRFEILKRCMSLENDPKWLCSEEELNKLRVSDDIYPRRYDLLMLNKSERNIMEKLYSPVFDFASRFLPVDLNRTFSEPEYLKYINELRKDNERRIRVYNSDLLGNHYLYLNSSTSPTILLPRPFSNVNGICECQTFNGIMHQPQIEHNKKISKNVCFPENITSCKVQLLYTENYVEFEIEDANEVDLIRPLNDDIFEEEKENTFKHLNELTELHQRYNIFLHNALDRPSMSTTDMRSFPKHTSSNIPISPLLIDAERDLTMADVSKRGCLFSFEKSLSLFQFYTYKNCILECQINCSLALCGCVPHRTAIFKGTHFICSNEKSVSCTRKHKFVSWHLYSENQCECNCPQNCVSLTYEHDDYFQEPLGSDQNTLIRITYKKPIFTSSISYSMTSPAEFVAYSLGILGVFNGFSMMIVWKMLYWLTLGLWSTIRRYGHFNH